MLFGVDIVVTEDQDNCGSDLEERRDGDDGETVGELSTDDAVLDDSPEEVLEDFEGGSGCGRSSPKPDRLLVGFIPIKW